MTEAPSGPMIAVDIGNTSVHFGLFPGGESGDLPAPALWLQLRFDAGQFDSLGAWLPPKSPPWVVASVNQEGAERLFSWVQRARPDVEHRQLDYTQMPIDLAIDHPETAGVDRLAAAVAANRLKHPDRAAVVVDFGTAITVDAISAEGAFLGGAILPGMELSATALLGGTSQLPVVDAQFRAAPGAIGRSTEPAIRGGLFWAAVGAVRQILEKQTEELGTEPQVFLSGGGADALLPHIDPRGEVCHAPHLVLSGIAMAARQLSKRK